MESAGVFLITLGDGVAALSDGAGIIIAVAAVLATCVKVWRWIDRVDERAAAVDTFRGDWAERGLTAAGAVAEQARYRDLTDTHTEALAAISRRADELHQSVERTAGEVAKVRTEVHDLSNALAAANVIDRRD